MNFKNEVNKLDMMLVSKLRNKYKSDEFFYGNPEDIIYMVCFSYLYKNDSKKNYIYLSKLLSYVDSKIDTGTYSKEIFAAIGTVASDIKRKINNNEYSIKEVIMKNKDSFDEETENCIRYLLNVLEENNYTREDLECFESNQVSISKNDYKYLPDPSSRGKIIGKLNEGFYGFTYSDLDKYLKENNGVGGQKDRFVSLMPDEILKYRIAIMQMAHLYASNGKKKRVNLNDMEEKYYHLGQIARDMFAREYLFVPEDIILENSKERKGNPRRRRKELPGQIKMSL